MKYVISFRKQNCFFIKFIKHLNKSTSLHKLNSGLRNVKEVAEEIKSNLTIFVTMS